MSKQLPRTTLKQHISNILERTPDGVKVSFELRTSFDNVTNDYILGQRGYGDETILLRFSVTKPRNPLPTPTESDKP
jgi:hypothetical protein